MSEYTRYGSIGISWVLVTLIYVYLGRLGGTWLDERFETDPLFLAVGLIVAIGLSFWSLIEQILRFERQRAKAKLEAGACGRVREEKRRPPKD